ncbi:MAG: ribonucleotide reductase N-terminal alpha domain-containing protein, partial [Gemmatimonadales bacterium]
MGMSGAGTPARDLHLSANAETVLKRRYLLKSDDGVPTEEPADLFWRVAQTIAAPDATYGASEGAVETLAEGGEVVLAACWAHA